MVLAWVAAGLVVGAAALVWHWWGRRVDSLGRPREFPLVSVLLALDLAAVALVPVARLASEERRLSRVASMLVGAPATVHCQPLSRAMVDATGDLGHVRIVDGELEHATLIKNEQCRLLARYAAGDQDDPSPDEVVAVHVLTHESMHMRGILDEAQAECAAMQRDTSTATALGADEAHAHALAIRYWLTVYPHMPDAYRTADCAPGGPLDERLPDAPWTPAG
jgi:hypothetical protein